MGLNRWLGCIENPDAGRESLRSPIMLSSKPKNVLVIGAGPGGLQSAISAAEHGHNVTVLERESLPGGQVRHAASIPNRAEFGDIVRNQMTACTSLGVKFQFDTDATVSVVRSHAPDHVVIATGAAPSRPWWASSDLERIVDVLDVLRGDANPAGRVAVLDELGFHHAPSIAELLADRGCSVEVITNGMVVGQDLGITLDMEGWCMRAASKGIAQTTDMVPMGAAATHDGDIDLQLMHHPTGSTTPHTYDWVVLCVPMIPVESLYFELQSAGVSVQRVGDCVAPRRAHAAVIDGSRVGASL